MRSRSDRPRKAPDAPDISVEPLKYRAGDVIAEKYRLEELMGQGGMGAVWRAHNLALEIDVALKLIHGELVSPETIERLQREAHATARLEHESVVRVFDLGQTDLGDPFIVMELLRGESLFDYLDRRDQLPAAEAVPLLLPVVSALAAAHAKNIVHRDLKPDNIVLIENEDGLLPKVVDFGIAIVDAGFKNRRSTTAGTILGSPDYMSPEQARGDEVDARTDMWSLAVVLYEVLSGRTPFTAPNHLAQIRAIVETEPPTLESLGAADARLSAIVERAMTKDPARRYPDMRAFGRALGEWAIGVGVETDVTGASIAAVWTRATRPSLVSGGSFPDFRASSPSMPRVPTPSAVLVWTPTGATASKRRLLWGAIGAVVLGAAASAGGYLLLRAPVTGRADGGAAATSEAQRADGTAEPAAAPSAAAQPARVIDAAPASAPSPTPAASATESSRSAPPADVPSCVAALLPPGALEPDAALDTLCTEVDPRRGAALLRSEIARHGLVHRITTDAMREWAALSWYELAAFALARGACCDRSKLPRLVTPQSIGACEPLGPVLEALGRATASGEADPLMAKFQTATACIQRGQKLNPELRSPFSYRGPPGEVAESSFRAILERVRR